MKEIGAILGFVAFGGLAVLTFLTFQQARHVRRLREWAGRSPERSAIEAERVAEAASEATIARAGSREAAGDDVEDPPEDTGPGFSERMRGEMAYRWEELDRRSPVDAKILVGSLLAVIVGVLIVTGGFGLFGGSSDEPTSTTVENSTGGEGAKSDSGGSDENLTKVAVLNGTAPEGGVGVSGVADVASNFVEEAGDFKVGNVTDAPTSFPVSVVMYQDGFEDQAQTLADALADQLGTTEILPIDPTVEDPAGRADLVLIVGQDDAAIAQ